jgi:hypothetical protein
MLPGTRQVSPFPYIEGIGSNAYSEGSRGVFQGAGREGLQARKRGSGRPWGKKPPASQRKSLTTGL